MFRRLILPLLVLTFILTACGGGAQNQGEEDSVQETAPAPQATPTEPPPLETPLLLAEKKPPPGTPRNPGTLVRPTTTKTRSPKL